LSGKREEEITDLLDAIHNIPEFLARREQWDDEFFKASFLDVYDRKWAGKSGLRLRDLYEGALRGETLQQIYSKGKNEGPNQPLLPPRGRGG